MTNFGVNFLTGVHHHRIRVRVVQERGGSRWRIHCDEPVDDLFFQFMSLIQRRMGSSPVSRGGGGTLGTVDSGFHDGDPPETTSDIDESELRRELLNDVSWSENSSRSQGETDPSIFTLTFSMRCKWISKTPPPAPRPDGWRIRQRDEPAYFAISPRNSIDDVFINWFLYFLLVSEMAASFRQGKKFLFSFPLYTPVDRFVSHSVQLPPV